MADEQVVISVTDDQVDDMSVVVDAPRAAGLRVSEVLDSAGVVTGTVDGEALASLSTVHRSRAGQPRRAGAWPDSG